MDESIEKKQIVYILCQDHKKNTPNNTSFSWAGLLPNGETVLERQLRILSSCGIRDYVLCMKRPLPELPTQLAPLLPVGCSIRVEEFNAASHSLMQDFDAESFPNSVILLHDFSIFDRTLAEEIIAAADACVVLSKNHAHHGLMGQIDFKNVQEIAPGLEGVNCFPVMRIYKLNRDSASLLAGESDLEKAIHQHLPALKLEPFFVESGYIDNPRTVANLKTVFEAALKREYAAPPIIRDTGCLSMLVEQMGKQGIKKPVLISDDIGDSSPVKDILNLYAIPYEVFSVHGELATMQGISDAKRVLENGHFDGMISVGGSAAINTGKLSRLLYVCNKELSDDFTELRVRCRMPHIVVPVEKAAAAEASSQARYVQLQGWRVIEHSHIIPDMTMLDRAVMPQPVKPERLQENEPKKKCSSLTSKIKKMLTPYPAVKRFASNTYKGLIFDWYKTRYRMNNQTVLFESYHGNQVTCNPFGIYDAMRSSRDYDGFQYIWAVNKPSKYRDLSSRIDTRVVRRGSREYLRAAATSRFLVSNMSIPEYIKPSKEQVYINTWHGKLIKKIGQDVENVLGGNRGTAEQKKRFTSNSKLFTYILSPAPVFTPHFISAFNLSKLHRENIVQETGYPRNDFLFKYTLTDVIRTKLRLGIPLTKKVVLYAPTWRGIEYDDSQKGYVYQNPLDFEQLKSTLGDDYVLLFRAHNLEAKSVDFSAYQEFVIDVTKVKEVNDLLIISDLLISDYSGIIYDFANLKRPIILYQYDREDYVNNQSGVYIDLDVLPGRLVQKREELAEAIIDSIAGFEYDEKYKTFNETYNGLDGADCGLRTAKMLIPSDTSTTESQRKSIERRRRFKTARCLAGAFFRETGLWRSENDKAIRALKDSHKGDRCFLIGNGPSLRMSDLEKLQNEYTFVCNKIYKSFEYMNWRPSYYFVSDTVFRNEIGDICNSFSGTLFSNDSYSGKKYQKYNIVCAHILPSPDYYVHGNMLEYYVPSAATVMTYMIEMAMYMGFQEIYLLGVDNSNGFVGNAGHFLNGYQTPEMKLIEHRRTRNVIDGKHLSFEQLGEYRMSRSNTAYLRLREYADKHGIQVYNATRGGYLEAFERVNFDDLEFKTPDENRRVP